MTKDFSQAKLVALVSGLSGKEAALLEVNYMIDAEKNQVSYDNEIEIIDSTVEKTFSHDQRKAFVKFYNLYVNTTLLSLDLQTSRLQLTVINSKLAHMQTVILWSCDSYRNLLLLRGGVCDDKTKIPGGWSLNAVKKNLGNAQMVERKDNEIVFRSEVTPIYSELVKDGKELIDSINNHKEVIKRIEQQYFENRVAVCEMQFNQAKTVIEDFDKTLALIVRDIEKYYNLFYFGNEKEFSEGKTINGKRVDIIDEKWVEERINYILDKSGL